MLSIFATEPIPTAHNSAHKKNTSLLLTLLRLEEKHTDIIIAINVPHELGEWESGAIDPEKDKLGPLLEAASAYRQKLWESFEVKDWDLFVN